MDIRNNVVYLFLSFIFHMMIFVISLSQAAYSQFYFFLAYRALKMGFELYNLFLNSKIPFIIAISTGIVFESEIGNFLRHSHLVTVTVFLYLKIYNLFLLKGDATTLSEELISHHIDQ